MLSKIIDLRKSSRRWLLRPCLDSSYTKTQSLYIDCVHGPPSTALSRWMRVTDVKAGHSPRGGGRRAVASAWPLMRNWDHGRSYSEWLERFGRASLPRKMHDIIVVGDPLISDDRSGSHPANTVFEPSNQAHQWTDRYEPMVLSLYLQLQRCSIMKR